MTELSNQDLLDLAWRDFIIWAFDNPQIRQHFEESSGMPALAETNSPLNFMIDRASGLREDYFYKFSIWATEAIWGMERAPAKMREEVARSKATAH